MNVIDRYMLRLIFRPMLMTLVVAVMILLLDNMLRLFKFANDEGGPVIVIWKMLATLLPEYLALGLPISLLIGLVLAFRRLGAQNELDALFSSQVTPLRLLRVPILYAVSAAALTFSVVGFLQPYSSYVLENLLYDLKVGSFGYSLRVGEFIKFGKDVVVRFEAARSEDNFIGGIFIKRAGDDGKDVVISAESGHFLKVEDDNRLLLRLDRGKILNFRHGESARADVFEFAQYDMPVELPVVPSFRGRGGKFEEMTLTELARAAYGDAGDGAMSAKYRKRLAKADIDPDGPEARAAALADQRGLRGEFHRRIAFSMISLMLPFLALAVATPPRRRAGGIGLVFGIVLIVALFKVLDFGAAMSFWWAAPMIWLPMLGYAALSLRLFQLFAYRVGAEPLGALYRLTDRAAALYTRFLGPRRAKRAKYPLGGP